MEHKKEKSKIFKIIKLIINIFITTILVGFIVVVLLQRFSDNKISFFNYRMFTVITGSMKPKYDIGDVLIAKKTNPATIKVGDDISYLGAVGDFRGKVVTHQVVGIEKNAYGKYIFHAKGLANLVEDPLISEDNLFGVVVHKSDILSMIYRIVATSTGFYLFIIIPLIYIIGSEILRTMLDKEAKRRAA